MKLRAPKDIETYLSADEAGRALEQLAANLRAARDPRLLVKWSIQLSYWNYGWNDPFWDGDLIVRQINYISGPQGKT